MIRTLLTRGVLAAVVMATALMTVSSGLVPAGAASSRPALKILLVDAGNNAQQPLPDVVASAKAAAQALTKSGQPVEFDICKPSGAAVADPNANVACVRQAIENKDVAFIGGPGDDGMALLEQAKIPVFAPNALTQTEYNSPISFQVIGGVPVQFAAQGAVLVKQGAKKIALLDFDLDVAKPIADFAKQAIKGAGGKVVDEINVPFQAVDVSSQVQQLKSSGADGALIITTEDIAAMLLRGMNQFGVRVKVSAPAGGLRQETLDSLGSLVDGMLAGAPVPHVNATGKNPSSLDQYIAEMKAAKSFTADDTRQTGIAAWLAVHAIAAAAKPLSGTVNGPALLEALQKSPGIDLPIVGKWVPSAAGPFPTYSRVSNGTGFYLRYAGNGNWATLKPVDGANMFALIQKAGGA